MVDYYGIKEWPDLEKARKCSVPQQIASALSCCRVFIQGSSNIGCDQLFNTKNLRKVGQSGEDQQSLAQTLPPSIHNLVHLSSMAIPRFSLVGEFLVVKSFSIIFAR